MTKKLNAVEKMLAIATAFNDSPKNQHKTRNIFKEMELNLFAEYVSDKYQKRSLEQLHTEKVKAFEANEEEDIIIGKTIAWLYKKSKPEMDALRLQMRLEHEAEEARIQKQLDEKRKADLWDLCVLLLVDYPVSDNNPNKRGPVLSAEMLKEYIEGNKKKVCSKCNQEKDYLTEYKWIKPRKFNIATHKDNDNLLVYHFSKTNTCLECLEYNRLMKQLKNEG